MELTGKPSNETIREAEKKRRLTIKFIFVGRRRKEAYTLFTLVNFFRINALPSRLIVLS